MEDHKIILLILFYDIIMIDDCYFMMYYECNYW